MSQITKNGQSFNTVVIVDHNTGEPINSFGGGSGGGSGSDRELVVTKYLCIENFLNGNVNDIITCTQVIDVTDTPVEIGTIWRNQTQSIDITQPPANAIRSNTNLGRELVVTTYQCIGIIPGSSIGDTITCIQVIDANPNTPVIISTIWRNESTIPPTTLSGQPNTNAIKLAISNVDLGYATDLAATTDNGNFSLISLMKRGLQNFSSLLTRIPSAVSNIPNSDQSAQPMRLVGQNTAGAGFSAVGSSVLDTFFNTPIVGTGVTYNQASGSLNIVAGTTVNAEFLARSSHSFCGSMRKRFTLIASQRIANNNLAVLLADLIGENLAVTINSATSITVAIPGHSFDATNVGQFVMVGGIVGAAGVPGRYAISSVVAGVSITLTVAGWPASGSCTASLFGRNYVRYLFTGSTSSVAAVDAQRNGWATGDTNITINSTLSPGTLVQAELTGREVFFSDSLRATSTSPNFTTRASRYENIPDQNIDLYVFLWSYNGTTAPATSTTFTLGHLSVENYANLPVYLEGNRSLGQQNALPVQLLTGTNSIGSISSISSAINANLANTTNVTDVTSAALTTTTTTASFSPTLGTCYEINIPVTAVSGTNPTLDVSIEESDDSGTNWFKVYDFPRITATGMYRSPKLPMTGNRIRYVQTVGGTTPSFTRSIVRVQSNDDTQSIRQIIDRTVVLTTLNSTTPSLNVQNCRNIQLQINIGAATTPPSITLQGSDDNGASWYNIGTALAAVVNSTVQQVVNNVNAQLVRANVSTAGTGVTAGYVLIKGF